MLAIVHENPLAVPTIVFSCKDGQAAFARVFNGEWESVFTHYWCDILKHDPTVTYRDAISQVNIDMQHEFYRQQAEVICRADILDMPVEVSIPDKAHLTIIYDMCRTKLDRLHLTSPLFRHI
jgi:hypothetical protein